MAFIFIPIELFNILAVLLQIAAGLGHFSIPSHIQGFVEENQRRRVPDE